MRIRSMLLALAVVASTIVGAATTAQAACTSGGARFEPPDGKVLMLVGQDTASMEAYVAGTGDVPGGFSAYTHIGFTWLGTSVPYPAPLGTPPYYTDQFAQRFVDNYKQSTILLAVYMKDQLDNVTLGVHDANIAFLGEYIKNTRRPVFLRLGYEFDGHQNFDPPKFVAAWRYIVDKLRAQGVRNVAYVWHSWAAPTYMNHPISAWYPGDAYVDWAAVSIFGQAFNNGANMAWANQLADFADAHGKPIMIAESTPVGRSTPTANAATLWNDWFAPVLSFINARSVKAWTYINADWEAPIDDTFKGWGDTRVEVNPALESMWLSEVLQPKYLHASPGLFCELGYP